MPANKPGFLESAFADHHALNDLRVNGFDPLAAARAYPQLVEALRQAIAADPSQAIGDGHLAAAAALLRSLGENIKC